MTTVNYFECHVTMIGSPDTIRPLVEEGKWTFSAIDGDPDLGAGVKCYATRQFNEKYGSRMAVGQVAQFASYLRNSGANVIREKVEHVIYDRRIK